MVAVNDPAWATQLRFLEVTLLERLAVELGPATITAIEVKVRPRGPSRPAGNAPDHR